MPMEGVYTEQTGPGTIHQLRSRALELERPYTGYHAPVLPAAVALEIAAAWRAAADEAQRMGWKGMEAEYRANAELARLYAFRIAPPEPGP